MSDSRHFMEVGIAHLRKLLEEGQITAVDLAAHHLLRISRYDCRGPLLNSTPLLNRSLFAEAAASDDRRAANRPASAVDGIPYTVKDSYKVRGMTVASGSPAFKNLEAREDAFVVHTIREAGGVLMGKTNMCPMAYGGLQRGVYGRTENPYNAEYLAAAFASGSSHGSGVSVSASFASFGMGGETVSSGRSPASNNSLVTYTPSKGLLSARGTWPLYLTCDVLIPHARTMADLLEVLRIIAVNDPVHRGDFWRDQPFLETPQILPDLTRVRSSLPLSGTRIAVPSCYVGGAQLAHSQPVFISPEVIKLWDRARADLEAQGAEVVIVNEFPALQIYENPACAADIGFPQAPKLPPNWNATERGSLIAHAWDIFLRDNNDPNIPRLTASDWRRMFPDIEPGSPQIAYAEPANMIKWSELFDDVPTSDDDDAQSESSVAQALQKTIESMYAIPNLKEACVALEAMRRTLFDEWLTANKFDFMAFPSAGDVGKSDADVSHESAKHAWANGVKYSHGNRALRHLGIPSVTVPMGLLEGKGVPMGLTLLGRAYEDDKLLGWGTTFEAIRERRAVPTSVPELNLSLPSSRWQTQREWSRPLLVIHTYTVSKKEAQEGQVFVQITGSITPKLTPAGPLSNNDNIHLKSKPHMELFIDSHLISAEQIQISPTSHEPKDINTVHNYSFSCQTSTDAPPKLDERERTEREIARDRTMTMILVRMVDEAENSASLPTGWFGLG